MMIPTPGEGDLLPPLWLDEAVSSWSTSQASNFCVSPGKANYFAHRPITQQQSISRKEI